MIKLAENKSGYSRLEQLINWRIEKEIDLLEDLRKQGGYTHTIASYRGKISGFREILELIIWYELDLDGNFHTFEIIRGAIYRIEDDPISYNKRGTITRDSFNEWREEILTPLRSYLEYAYKNRKRVKLSLSQRQGSMPPFSLTRREIYANRNERLRLMMETHRAKTRAFILVPPKGRFPGG